MSFGGICWVCIAQTRCCNVSRDSMDRRSACRESLLLLREPFARLASFPSPPLRCPACCCHSRFFDSFSPGYCPPPARKRASLAASPPHQLQPSTRANMAHIERQVDEIIAAMLEQQRAKAESASVRPDGLLQLLPESRKLTSRAGAEATAGQERRVQVRCVYEGRRLAVLEV